MLKRRFSAAITALVVAISIPSFAFASDTVGTEVTANVGKSVMAEANSGIISGITNNGNADSTKQETTTAEGTITGGSTDNTTGNQQPAEQNKDTVKEETGSQPGTEAPKADNPAPAVDKPTVEEPATEQPATTEPAVVVDPVTTEPAVVVDPVTTEPAVVVDPVTTEPAVVVNPTVTEPAIVVEPIATQPAIVAEPATLKIIYHGKYQDLDETLEEVVEGHNVGDVVDLSEYINKMMKAEYIIYVGEIKEITLKSTNDVVELDYSIDENKYKLK